MIAHARRITVDGQVWQWRVKFKKFKGHCCGDPRCCSSGSVLKFTAFRLADGLLIRDVFNVDSPITPAIVASYLNRVIQLDLSKQSIKGEKHGNDKDREVLEEQRWHFYSRHSSNEDHRVR